MGQIILASASPRRKELLEQIGISFEICPAKGEERITKSVPHEVVEELASQKAVEVASMVRTYEETHQELVTPSDLMVIGADTIVSCGGQILGKPKDEHDACRMLKLLSGGTHQVYTGVSRRRSDAMLPPASRWTRRAHMEFRGNVRFLLTKLMATIIML